MSEGILEEHEPRELSPGSAAAVGGSSGVDRTQIERMLDLSPVERLELLEDWLTGIAELRDRLRRERDVGEAR